MRNYQLGSGKRVVHLGGPRLVECVLSPNSTRAFNSRPGVQRRNLPVAHSHNHASTSVTTAGRCIQPNDPVIDLCPSQTKVYEHYRDTIDDYFQWSAEGNLHFGYWRWGINPFHRAAMLAEMNRQILSRLELSSACRGDIADLGCGVGAFSRYGASQFPETHWHAVNLSPHQIEFARHHYTNDRVSYYNVDYHHLPFHDASLDGAAYVESLCYSQQPTRALKEVARVLKSGARLVISDGFLRSPIEEASGMFRAMFSAVSENWAVPAYHHLDSLREAIGEAGLEVKCCDEIGWRIAPCVCHSIPLTIWCSCLLKKSKVSTEWRWKQLRASSLAMLLGLHRRRFGY